MPWAGGYGNGGGRRGRDGNISDEYSSIVCIFFFTDVSEKKAG